MYELRLYDVAAGRQADEVARMYDVAINGEPAVAGGPPVHRRSMFDRHGVKRPLGAWTSLAGTGLPMFGYLLKWDSLKQRDASFPAFWSDPLWQGIRNQTDAGSPMVERTEDWLLDPSPAWVSLRAHGTEEPLPHSVHELRIERVANGLLPQATTSLREAYIPFEIANGALLLGVFNVVIGPQLPCVVTFLAWPDYATQAQSAERFHTDKSMIERERSDTATHGRPLFESRNAHILVPVDFARPKGNFGTVP